MTDRPGPEAPLPGEVTALLGPDLVEHPGAGACRVVSGGGLVAKVGPEDVVARERAVLAAAGDLPLSVPSLIDAGPGWIVTRAEDDEEGPWSGRDLHAALADLARLHDTFEAAPDRPAGWSDRPAPRPDPAGLPGSASGPDPAGLSGSAPGPGRICSPVPPGLREVLLRPFSPPAVEALLAPVRRLGVPLPGPLGALLDDPAPLLAAAAAEPPTLLHGDPWPANVLRPAPGRRVWIDWEQAAFGPAAADVASWLDQTPWHIGASSDGHLEAYLAARSAPVDATRFARVLDAATVLWFLAHDVPVLAAGRSPAADDPFEAGLPRAQRAATRVLGG